MENLICVLRNLSYQLENEVDLQDGAEDVLDQAWEAEQRRELEEVIGRLDHTHYNQQQLLLKVFPQSKTKEVVHTRLFVNVYSTSDV